MTINDYSELLTKASKRRYFISFLFFLFIANVPSLIGLFSDCCQILSINLDKLSNIIQQKPILKYVANPITISIVISISIPCSAISALLFFNDIKKRHFGRLQLTLDHINNITGIIHKKFYDYIQRNGNISSEELKEDFVFIADEIPKSLSSLLTKLCNEPISVHFSIIKGLTGLNSSTSTDLKASTCTVQSISFFNKGSYNSEISTDFKKSLKVADGYWYNRLYNSHNDILIEREIEKLKVPDGLIFDGPKSGTAFIGKIIIKTSVPRKSVNTCVGFLRIYGSSDFLKTEDERCVVRGIFQQYAYKTAMLLEKMHYMLKSLKQVGENSFINSSEHKFSENSKRNKKKRYSKDVKSNNESTQNSNSVHKKRSRLHTALLILLKKDYNYEEGMFWNQKH